MTLRQIPLDQLAIAFTGVVAVFFTQSKRPWMQRTACLFGLAGQPFWLYAALTAHQWGIVFAATLYAIAWAKGVWTYWGWYLQHPITAVRVAIALVQIRWVSRGIRKRYQDWIRK